MENLCVIYDEINGIKIVDVVRTNLSRNIIIVFKIQKNIELTIMI